MLNTLSDNLRDLQKTSETAVGRVARSAGSMADHLEDWAEEGIGSARESMQATPLLWGAAFSLGIAALVGLFAYKRVGLSTAAKARSATIRKAMSAEARARQSIKRRSKQAQVGRKPAKKAANGAGHGHI